MNAAVIVDSRPINGDIVEYQMKHLPGWELLMYIQPNSLAVRERFGCKSILCPSINSLNDYNRFMTSPQIWERLSEFDRVLIFQQDSMILRDGIDEFLEWDYIGAPWKWQPEPRQGGNGGLSLRNPKKCLDLVKQKAWSLTYGYEDVYFTNHLHEVGGRVAGYDVCRLFSCETMFELGTFGYHAIDKYLSTDQVNKIKRQYD
jgi:hypothetical protein